MWGWVIKWKTEIGIATRHSLSNTKKLIIEEKMMLNMFGESLIVYHGLFRYDKSVYKKQKANYNIEALWSTLIL